MARYIVDGQVLSLHEILDRNADDAPADTEYRDLLNSKLNDLVGKENDPSAKISSKYDQIVKIPDGKC